MKKYIITLIFGLLLLNSCAERLNIERVGEFFPKILSARQMNRLRSHYSHPYSTWRVGIFNWFYLKNMLSDDTYCGGGSRGDNSNFEIDQANASSSTAEYGG